MVSVYHYRTNCSFSWMLGKSRQRSQIMGSIRRRRRPSRLPSSSGNNNSLVAFFGTINSDLWGNGDKLSDNWHFKFSSSDSAPVMNRNTCNDSKRRRRPPSSLYILLLCSSRDFPSQTPTRSVSLKFSLP